MSETGQVPLSPLDELRAEFAQRPEPARLLKKFPGRSGRLVGEYTPMAKKTVREAAATESDEDALADAIVRVLIHDPEHAAADKNGNVPLGTWVGKPNEDPLKFDHRLADILGIVKGTPAQIVLELFDGNDLALAEVAGEVAQWSTDTHNTAYADF